MFVLSDLYMHVSCFLFLCDADHRDRHVLTHSFPTRRPFDLCGSICHTTARSTSASMPRSVMLLLEPMPTYRNRPARLAAIDLVQWGLILDGRSTTLTGAPLAFVWPAV